MITFFIVTQAEVLATALDGNVWSAGKIQEALKNSGSDQSTRTVLRALNNVFRTSVITSLGDVSNSRGDAINRLIVPATRSWLKKKRLPLEIIQLITLEGLDVVVLANTKGRLIWQAVRKSKGQTIDAIGRVLEEHGGKFGLIPSGQICPLVERLALPDSITNLASLLPPGPFTDGGSKTVAAIETFSYLDLLEAESMRIIRETVAVASKPAMLFSMGKDSMAMLRLAQKAFFPDPIPFPLVVIDTRWKFQDMYRFREYLESQPDLEVIVYTNPEAIERDVNPFDFGSATHTDITKTQALRKVLDTNGFDFVLGGARRDEEKSRAKERIFSIRNESHGWDPKTQRPELWDLYNTVLTEGETIRTFPISNWTETDVWRYLEREQVAIVPLYFSALRPFVKRDNALIMVDDERFPLREEEQISLDYIRFRTLGCYPLTGGTRSKATNLAEILNELQGTQSSERSSRVIDFDQGASMEQKKRDGYF